LVGRRPNHPESAMIALLKKMGYQHGPTISTYVKWHKRSLKRAQPPSPRAVLPSESTGPKFYANCVWGPFKGGGPYEMDIAFPNIFEKGGVDFEIDGINFHRDEVKDAKRDGVLKANGWAVVRITDRQLYQLFVPLLNTSLRGKKDT